MGAICWAHGRASRPNFLPTQFFADPIWPTPPSSANPIYKTLSPLPHPPRLSSSPSHSRLASLPQLPPHLPTSAVAPPLPPLQRVTQDPVAVGPSLPPLPFPLCSPLIGSEESRRVEVRRRWRKGGARPPLPRHRRDCGSSSFTLAQPAASPQAQRWSSTSSPQASAWRWLKLLPCRGCTFSPGVVQILPLRDGVGSEGGGRICVEGSGHLLQIWGEVVVCAQR